MTEDPRHRGFHEEPTRDWADNLRKTNYHLYEHEDRRGIYYQIQKTQTKTIERLLNLILTP